MVPGKISGAFVFKKGDIMAEKAIYDKAKSVQRDMIELAHSLEFIKQTIGDVEIGEEFKYDLAFSMLGGEGGLYKKLGR